MSQIIPLICVICMITHIVFTIDNKLLPEYLFTACHVLPGVAHTCLGVYVNYCTFQYIYIYIYISGPLAQAFGRVSLGLPLHIYTVPSRPLYVDNGKLDRSSHEQTKFPASKEFLKLQIDCPRR